MCVNLRKRETFPEDKHVFLSGPKVLMTSLLAANLSVTSVITHPFCRCEFFPISRKNISHQHYPQFSSSRLVFSPQAPPHFHCPLQWLLTWNFVRHEHNVYPSEHWDGHQSSRWQGTLGSYRRLRLAFFLEKEHKEGRSGGEGSQEENAKHRAQKLTTRWPFPWCLSPSPLHTWLPWLLQATILTSSPSF